MPSNTKATSNYLLAIETSGARSSFAICRDDTLISEIITHLSPNYRDRLAHWIDYWLKELDITPHQLSGVAVSAGPGAFTGLRAGMSVVKGLCLALDIPLWAVPTLEAMAFNAINTDRLLCPTTLARNKECYAAIYQRTLEGIKEILPPIAANAETLAGQLTEPALLWGEGVDNIGEELQPLLSSDQVIMENDTAFPRASGIARWAQQAINNGLTPAEPELEPFYLKQFPG